MKDSAYKEAGVDIEAAAGLIDRIKPHVAKTARTGVMSGIGGFGALFDLKQTGFTDPVLVSSTDGVGTKIKIAIETELHDTIGIDAVAMCVNDIVVQGAEPLFFLDYFATGKLDNDTAEAVIAGVAEGCIQAGCALIGGETAEMPGLYAPGDYDLAGFTVGAVERSRVLTGERIKPGDVILGLASSGFHSNGFSLVRHVLSKAGLTYDSPAPFLKEKTKLGTALLVPTRIYVKPLLAVLKESDQAGYPLIKGMAHITGGGLIENIPRILPDSVTAHIDAATWDLPPAFRWIKEAGGLGLHDMATTLNCGIGLAAVCAPEYAGRIQEILSEAGETVCQIGTVQARGAGEEPIVLHNAERAWG
ncbi:MAG: phosphoribosylformylglycinamidine cyclo-ligase [Alphaproteobacteria bacterium]|nr:phosphoribosylformylglycinamidine cyclo-ligase [Alphaproteobacteria bacterium]